MPTVKLLGMSDYHHYNESFMDSLFKAARLGKAERKWKYKPWERLEIIICLQYAGALIRFRAKEIAYW